MSCSEGFRRFLDQVGHGEPTVLWMHFSMFLVALKSGLPIVYRRLPESQCLKLRQIIDLVDVRK